MPHQYEDESATFEFVPATAARKRRSHLCGPLGRMVGVLTLVCALGGMLNRTSMHAANMLMSQTVLPTNSQELMACLKHRCNNTITDVGLHWQDPRNARLLKCLTHSPGGLSAGDCWSPDDTAEGRAVESCAVCNSCAAGDARCNNGRPVHHSSPRTSPRRPRPVPVATQPHPAAPVAGTPVARPDWSTGWMRFVPGAAPATTTAADTSALLSTTVAAVSPRPVHPSKGNSELLACIHHYCREQSDKVGSTWTNPVNTDVAACLADSNGGLGAAVNCFPPVDPLHEAVFRDSTALRYCAMCSSCIAGDRGSKACNKHGFAGFHEVKPRRAKSSKLFVDEDLDFAD